MGRATTKIGRDPEDAMSIDGSGVGGGKIVRDKDVRFAMQRNGAGRFALEIANDPTHHVLNIERALTQVRIIDMAKRLSVSRSDLMKNSLDIDTFTFEFAQYFVDQGAVLHHEQMRVENASVFGADGLGDFLLHLQN